MRALSCLVFACLVVSAPVARLDQEARAEDDYPSMDVTGVTFRDSSDAGRDEIRITARFPVPDGLPSASEVETGLTVIVPTSDQGEWFEHTIPARDPGWSTSGTGVQSWSSPPGGEPRIRLRVDGIRGRIAATVAGFDFPAPLWSDSLWVGIRVGGFQAGGSAFLTQARPNVFAYRSPRTQRSREAFAMAALREILRAQQEVLRYPFIDVDGDGLGEAGVLSELAGFVGVRGYYIAGPPPAADWIIKRGLLPAFLPPWLSPQGYGSPNGFATRHGYAFVVFLPDGGVPASFVHEAQFAQLAGGTATVGIDLSESAWCAYAQPLEYGVSGRRRFYIDQTGLLLASSNAVARAEGTGSPVAGDSALTGPYFSSAPAIGAVGRDGDLWDEVR